MITRQDAWWITILALAVLEPVSLMTSQVPPCLVNPANYGDNQECPTLHGFVIRLAATLFQKLDDHNWVVAIGTIVIAFFTATLWYSTRKLWGVTRDTLQHAELTAERQLRAYISVEIGENIRQSQKHRLRFEFRPTIKNNGHTPANEVRVVSWIRISDPTIPADFDYALGSAASGPFSSVTAIGPSQFRFHSSVFPRNLTFQEMREIRKGRKCFHIYGMVTYTDVFRESRHTNFSYIIFVSNKRGMTVWHSTENHNDAD